MTGERDAAVGDVVSGMRNQGPARRKGRDGGGNGRSGDVAGVDVGKDEIERDVTAWRIGPTG